MFFSKFKGPVTKLYSFLPKKYLNFVLPKEKLNIPIGVGTDIGILYPFDL